MIRCCVVSCDTDENVVNSTSVFFVGFPTNPMLHKEWMNILASNNSLLDGIITERTKICSCHFDDDAFGKHPVHGYRFLLPTAIPTVFPPIEEDASVDLVPDDAIDANDLVEDETNLLSYCETKPILFDINKQTLEEFGTEDMSVATSVSDLEQATKAIGIEYADGKYYFLQSEDECADDLIERDDQSECKSTVLSLPPQDVISYDHVVEKTDPSASDFSIVVDEVFRLKQAKLGADSLTDQIVMETDADSMIEFANSIAPSECPSNDYSELKSNIEYVVVKEEDHEEVGSLIEVIEDDELAISESPVTEYGTVEMLDDSGTQSTVRRKGARIDKHFCKSCGKGFPYESGLKKHEFVHNGEKPHVCNICGKSFSQKVNLTIHSRRHTGEETVKKFPCPFCDKKCTRMSELKIHMKTHWKKLPHPCQLCTERFAEVTSYYDHLKTQHKDELTLQECIDMIAQNENAELIVPEESYSVTGEDGSFMCTVCLKSFRSERLLRKHKRKMHPKVFVCSQCPKRFLYKSLLDKHVRVHTQEKPFMCQHCERAFSQKVNLEVHLFKRHNVRVGNISRKTSSCEFCNKVFDRPSSLQVHIRTHTKERPFYCRDCPKTFVSNSALASHIKHNHRGESLLLQPSQRNLMAKSESYVLQVCNESTDLVEGVSGDGDQMIQYSIEIINPIEPEGSLSNIDPI
ncbi:zinc finger protein 286A-like [Topomyia yanbarensis]|uniref:zinc finger protein 286A-like n=1 Tax=Topomyia yanbarensis TaxID=2498891 RepID=UPI00273AA2D1|nr:zinc finger protein 286A-like [Topomyia yanbarensis]